MPAGSGGPLDAIATAVLLLQVVKLTHLPQTLTIHLLRFSIRDARTEKVCHSLYFPQSLDLNQVFLAERDPPEAEDQVRRVPCRPPIPSDMAAAAQSVCGCPDGPGFESGSKPLCTRLCSSWFPPSLPACCLAFSTCNRFGSAGFSSCEKGQGAVAKRLSSPPSSL